MLRSAFLAFAFCILSSPNALSRNATPRIVRSSGNSPFAPSTTDEALSESDQRNELLRTPEPSVPLNTLHQRQSSLPTLVFSFVVPSLDQTFAPLKDLFRVVVDDLQAQGVLSGANILVQPNTTGQSRTAVVGSIVNVATVDPSLGVIDLSPYPLDAASLASLFAFPLCEPRADFQELSDADTYTTLFRTTTDDSLRDAPVLDFVADQGWPQITNLYTSSSRTVNGHKHVTNRLTAASDIRFCEQTNECFRVCFKHPRFDSHP
ncbi:uncharacterized protein EV422DRAFT_143399 [Fimicolochytrium jonesii]|uniref:uncharacterized protein n=1 Tax=Fimicolochytrium jonesii TaxID=1396493 RepID=UPI0022FEEC3E|nr:uncharacterized protein EV422DRAFT_143399 [Fimicolochytrium jonesii]KAI8825842.1 hypothetical protein EV422DRAFT_143399 [Fimicolochytrium jonesii]